MVTRKVALRQLNKLVGSWQTSVTVLAGPDSGKPISGFNSYKWLPGEMFLQHTWNVRIPDGLHRGVEIYNYDPDLQTIYTLDRQDILTVKAHVKYRKYNCLDIGECSGLFRNERKNERWIQW